MTVGELGATLPIVFCPVLGFLFALLYVYHVSKVSLLGNRGLGVNVGSRTDSAQVSLVSTQADCATPEQYASVREKAEAITDGAITFLVAEYRLMAIFIVGFGLLVLLALGLTKGWDDGIFTCISFVLGSCTSILSGFIGMRIAVYANSRTAISAMVGWTPAFTIAFKAGVVMGFALCSLALIVLFIAIALFYLKWPYLSYDNPLDGHDASAALYEAIAGYGLGGSSIALFGRVGGGIYTKAADVGADLSGKNKYQIEEDDPRNPAVVADNVGDNVGDIAGMGADLFGSFAEASCAALVVASTSRTTALSVDWAAMNYPLMISAGGIVVCFITSFFATHIMPVKSEAGVEKALKNQILISTLLMTPMLFGLSMGWLPSDFEIGFEGKDGKSHWQSVKNWHVFFCGACGLWSGMIIGYITEYFTSNTYAPVKDVAKSCETGAATNIIYGLALGYKSVIIPIICLVVTIYVSFKLAWMFGVAIAALGILSTLSIGLTIDAYGPICDNAGGIAEMCELGAETRARTDALDAAGNTTAAIGKGFAIGSAALVSLALFGAYVTRSQLVDIDIMQPFPFAGLMYGAMLPYAFSAMTMKSVGKAALQMVKEVMRQFEDPEVRGGAVPPDYNKCIKISTDASLREMLAPGALVMLTPLVVGIVFGVEALAGVLAGALVSGVQMAISASNTGGAWDNAKKYVESGQLYINGEQVQKHSEEHKAAVVGDTVGDPLKDTSGPALNILMKLMAVESLVFAPFFIHISSGKGLVGYIH